MSVFAPNSARSTFLPSTSGSEGHRRDLPGEGPRLRYVDWIWRIRGRVALAPGQSGHDALSRLEHLVREKNTSYRLTDDALVFAKSEQAAQDKMSIFDHGVLSIRQGVDGPFLRYDLMSRALLFCFLAPLLFLGIAQVTTMLAAHEKAKVAAAGKPNAKDAAKNDKALPLNPIDKFLGAPAPDKPKKDKDKKGKKDKDDEKGGKDKLSPTPAYVFAGIFLALYIGGRILENWLIQRLFRKNILADS